ncbi:acyl-CoA dehydrogenase family protein [Diaphorobacter ruginosibacter]|uniref:acyl-CoA dehydrogenase family protein n=1 Tax=Diaphorobacter ruginosibacter TaxID=1715720 RepID=UPI003342383F
MNFEHTQDRRMLADSLNRFLGEQYGSAARNRIAYGAQGRSPQLHAQLAELGAIGALFPEDAGGFGGSGFDISLVFECLGRGLVTEPLLGALLAGQALVRAGSAAQKDRYLAGIIDGSVLAAFAHDEPGSHYEAGNVKTGARRTGGGWVISGAKAVVSFGEEAHLLLVTARVSGQPPEREGIALFLVPGDAQGISRRGYPRFEGGRACELRFDDVEVGAQAMIGTPGDGADLLESICEYALLALSSEALGAMDVVKQGTLEYLQTRKQFGVPIGSFQALQHRMADVLLEVEQARSAVINAADAIDNAQGRTRALAMSAAKYSTGRIGTLVAEECIQLHGGIGMTWELPLAHYAKRLVMIDHQFGDEDHHLSRYIALS